MTSTLLAGTIATPFRHNSRAICVSIVSVIATLYRPMPPAGLGADHGWYFKTYGY